ncbi:MAG TPA: hypothetical protein VII99_09875, partial [Bacteroidia bacterium]
MKKTNLLFRLCILVYAFHAGMLHAQNQSTYLRLTDALSLSEKNYPLLKSKEWRIKAASEHL